VELYDLQEDPDEFHNTAGQPEYAAIQQRLLSQLGAWRRRTNDPLIDRAKLDSLTREQDGQAKKYKKGLRSDSWEYHQYLND
jgi:hypothetical protein